MAKILSVLFTGIVFSLYYFPFMFKALPGVNTKMMLAVVGLVILIIKMAMQKKAAVSKDIFLLSCMAAVVSLAGFISVTINDTPDFAYATYILSMWVWLSAAYAVCSLIYIVHGYIDVRLIANYLIAVCVVQCALAIIIDMNPVIQNFVDRYIEQGQDFLHKVKRIYGIGANLDVAGSRFAVAITMITYILFSSKEHIKLKTIVLYICAFIIILTAGNMIARTTSVGIVTSVLYLFIRPLTTEHLYHKNTKRILLTLVFLTSLFVPALVFLYNTDPTIHSNLRFAFEGFFNLAEQGEWSIASNERLMTMYVFPETLKTWIIGDGYFSNPRDTDPLFIGKEIGGYYMGTDVGYLRFIFYSGIIGLAAFSYFIIYSCRICMNNYTKDKALFLLLLAINFTVWFKVSTDIFLAFALFIAAIPYFETADNVTNIPEIAES